MFFIDAVNMNVFINSAFKFLADWCTYYYCYYSFDRHPQATSLVHSAALTLARQQKRSYRNSHAFYTIVIFFNFTGRC